MAVENATNGTVALNETITATAPVFSSAGQYIALVLSRLWDLISAPFIHQEMLWIIFPLFFTLIVMEFYYDHHEDEELGWGAALANSLILLIVSIDLLKHSFHYATPFVVAKEIFLAAFTDATLPLEPQVLILILFLGGLGAFITIINYFHLMPRQLAFVLSGHAPINFLAYFAIAIVYSTGTEHPIPFDMPTLIAAAILFILILLAIFSIKRLVLGRKKHHLLRPD
jgi:hypothetical protein